LKFRGNGKLLISGEYFVLDGAKALAIPTRLGHELQVGHLESPRIHWHTFVKEAFLFSADFDEDLEIIESTDNEKAEKVVEILSVIEKEKGKGWLMKSTINQFQSFLEFPMEWGLGSSSTLIYSLASWSGIDPFLLCHETFGGSGYDIACAGAQMPILYALRDKVPTWNEIDWDPSFSDQLYFVYLNEKKNSREAMKSFRQNSKEVTDETLDRISQISEKLSETNDIAEFCDLIEEHEDIVSVSIGEQKVKDRLFPDFNGTLKSLGGWGGDFIMCVAWEDPREYFEQKGYKTVIPWREMILDINR
jgi:mevalonate kinase